MLSVGQELFYVKTHNKYVKGTCVVVVKIGRKWAELSNGDRINKDTLWTDGGQYSSPGRCWLSEADYDTHIITYRIWNDFASRISRGAVPDGLTEQAIRQAAALLSVPLNEV